MSGKGKNQSKRVSFCTAAYSNNSRLTLETIGVIQMEKELVIRYKSREKYSSQLEIEEEPYYEEDMMTSICHLN